MTSETSSVRLNYKTNFFILPLSIDLTIGLFLQNTQQQASFHFKRVTLLNILKKHLTVHHCLIHIDNGSKGFSILVCVCVCVYIYINIYIYNVLILCYPKQGHFRRYEWSNVHITIAP